ncbi:FecR family protein [soil metagenome]
MRPEIKEEALQWFVRLQDIAATEEDWLAFQEWQEADDDHARAYRRLDQTWAAVDHAEALAMPANDVVERPIGRGPGYRGPHRAWLVAGLGIAASLVVAIGLWPELTGSGVVRTYHAGAAPLAVDLADGSHIYLNRGTDVHVRLGRHERIVILDRGEAGFDVDHDASRPFTVDAGDHSVRVLGTAFNVIRQDDRFRVSVARGAVSISAPGLPGPARLAVGQQFDQTGSAAVDVSTISPEQAFAWRQGVLVYRNRPLGDVAADLSRYLDKPVVVDPSASGLRFTGSLRVADEQTMIDKLDDYLPVVARRAPEDIRLSARPAR